MIPRGACQSLCVYIRAELCLPLSHSSRTASDLAPYRVAKVRPGGAQWLDPQLEDSRFNTRIALTWVPKGFLCGSAVPVGTP